MDRAIDIDGRKLTSGAPVFVIAEAGINHNGDLAIAKELVKAAFASGADAVKFQTYLTENLILKKSENRDIFAILKKSELAFNDFTQLKSLADEVGILFLSTPFDLPSVDFLLTLGIKALKVASADITHTPMIEAIAKSGLPVLLSTGMADLDEIKKAVDILEQYGNSKICLLHATIAHPAPLNALNLEALETLKKSFPYPVGYSDHTADLLTPCIAVAKGACVIEKHFTLDKKMEGPDHAHSLSPSKFKEMIRQIRKTEKILGSGEKHCYDIEKETKKLARRSIVASVKIAKGEIFTSEMFTFKLPGTGLPPGELPNIIGNTAAVEIQPESLLTKEMMEMDYDV